MRCRIPRPGIDKTPVITGVVDFVWVASGVLTSGKDNGEFNGNWDCKDHVPR